MKVRIKNPLGNRKFKKNEALERTKTPKKIKFSPWYVIYAFLIISAIALLPTKVVSYQVNEMVEDLEEYTVSVPYQTTEEYVEEIPVQEEEEYETTICSDYFADYSKEGSSERSGFFNQNLIITCEITNEEDKSLQYSYQLYADASNSVQDALSADYYSGMKFVTVGPYQTETVSTTFDVGSGQMYSYCRVHPPMIERCNEHTQTRLVTEYKSTVKVRDVTKYRDETRYRPVENTVQKTMYKEVNWLFGFKPIVKFRDLGEYES